MITTAAYTLLRLIKSRWLPWGLLLFSIMGMAYLGISNVQKSVAIRKQQDSIVYLETTVLALKERLLVYQNEVNNWKNQTAEAQTKLSRAIAERQSLENELRSKVNEKWKNSLTGDCQKDVDFLKKSAMEKQK